MTTATEKHPARETSCVNAVCLRPRVLGRPAGRRPRRRLRAAVRRRSSSARSGRCCCSRSSAPSSPSATRRRCGCSSSGSSSASSPSTAYGSERFAWLVLHPLLPLILLAGLGLQWIWQSRSPGAAAPPASPRSRSARSTSASPPSRPTRRYRADPRNLLVSTQTSEQVRDLAEQVEELRRRRRSRSTPAEGATFPYAWYFREMQLGLHRRDDGRLHARHAGARADRDRATSTLKPNLAAYDVPALRLPRLVGQGVLAGVPDPRARAEGRRRPLRAEFVGQLVHRPQAVEPDGRDEAVVLRPHGRRARCRARGRRRRSRRPRRSP